MSFFVVNTVSVKRNAHLFPTGKGGPKIHMIDYVNGSSN